MNWRASACTVRDVARRLVARDPRLRELLEGRTPCEYELAGGEKRKGLLPPVAYPIAGQGGITYMISAAERAEGPSADHLRIVEHDPARRN